MNLDFGGCDVRSEKSSSYIDRMATMAARTDEVAAVGEDRFS